MLGNWQFSEGNVLHSLPMPERGFKVGKVKSECNNIAPLKTDD